ncbi:MAG: DnaD domain protein [Ruminococcaceae bacterium]|nr:DnaD domain protein [Oscillospiraceae bacterium]
MMKYNVLYKDGAVCLPASAFLNCDTLLEVRFLMLLSYDRALCDADDTMLCEQLGCTVDELTETVSSLREKGLLEGERKLAPSVANKNLSGKEIAGAIESDNSLKQLIEECEAICGKVFTTTDVSKIVSLKNSLGLDSETVLLLFYYHFEKLDAVGKKLTVSYVEKSAYSLYNQGIRTFDSLQSYIKENERRNSNKYKVARLFGIGERAFTKKEEKFFDKWFIEWEMPFELIEAAFEIAVNNTGKAGLEYMSKILSDWHDSGISTVEQAEKANADFKAANKNKQKFVEKPANNGASFDTEEFFEKARRRSEAMMNAIVLGEGDK